MLAADTPLAAHPSLALAGFGFLTGYALLAGWTGRFLWGRWHDRCGQAH